MDDPDVDHELIALLRESLGFSNKAPDAVSSDTGVLKDAEFIAHNAIDVALSMYGTRDAAASLYKAMCERKYSTETWSEHELHPKLGVDVDEVGLVNFVFTMDLLNFSFWSEKSAEERYQVEYRGKLWTGYNSLVACLRRGLDDGIPITTPRFWRSNADLQATVAKVFAGATDESIPLLEQRVAVLKEAGDVLHETFRDEEGGGMTSDENDDSNSLVSSQSVKDADMGEKEGVHIFGSVSVGQNSANGEFTPATSESQVHTPAEHAVQVDDQSTHVNHKSNERPPALKHTEAQDPPDMTVIRLIDEADHSAGKLVNLLAKHFPCFRDEGRFEGRKVRFLKRAQIFVADLWAAFNGKSFGEFYDIGHLTMFADYRVPQMLYNLGVLTFAPPVEGRLRRLEELKSGESWELQLRGCSIWAVELIRRQIGADHPGAEAEMHAVLLDFLLYDLAKEFESSGTESIPHHRTRSIWY